MRGIKLFLLGLLILGVVFSSFASDEDTFKREILKQVDKVVRQRVIDEPIVGTTTRSPHGPKLYRRIVNSVVLVIAPNGFSGSGIVISIKGLIITNWHVVTDQSWVGVIFKPPDLSGKFSIREKDVFFAYVIATDPIRDLALLKLTSAPPRLSVAFLGYLSPVEVGEDVFAIGHPEGYLWSYTEGVISQIRKKYEWKTEAGTVHRATVIQTQTTVGHGSSGGPLFNSKGELIGVIAGGKAPGLNFAIAVDEVREFLLSAVERKY